jgi:hypothetical protein
MSGSSSSSEASIHLERIADLESLMVAIAAQTADLRVEPSQYTLVGIEKGADMLSWKKPAELQQLLMAPLARVGTVGDGNCMLHSLLYAASPTYRAHNTKSRSVLADQFREILVEREEELKDLADAFFPEIGGAEALAESFETLREHREEVNLELGLLIARLYECNFLAVQVLEDTSVRPVRVTLTNRSEELPTIVVNYIGGGLDFGHANFQEDGHYEVIIAADLEPPVAAAASSSSEKKKRRKTQKKKKAASPPPRTLNEVTTRYIFQPGDETLASLMAVFAVSSSQKKTSSHGGARLTRRRRRI